MSLGVSGSSAGAGGDYLKIGTYTGSGGAGASNAKSLTFDKKPIMVRITKVASPTINLGVWVFAPYHLSSEYKASKTFYVIPTNSVQMGSNSYAKYDDSTNTLSFYPSSTSYVSQTPNEAGATYLWEAFFEE